MARGHIEVNPAGELINAALPAMPAVKSHFRALPYHEVAVGTRNHAVDASGASWSSRLCFRFLDLDGGTFG